MVLTFLIVEHLILFCGNLDFETELKSSPDGESPDEAAGICRHRLVFVVVSRQMAPSITVAFKTQHMWRRGRTDHDSN